jgi:hypothetical protein
MENLSSQSKSSYNTRPCASVASPCTHAEKLCALQATPECRLVGGKIDAKRSRGSNTRYCASCAYRLKLDRNAANKRRKRREIGSSAYAEAYSPFLTETERKAAHRKYMRAYRAWRKHRSELFLVLTEPDLRAYRRKFIEDYLVAHSTVTKSPVARAAHATATTHAQKPLLGSLQNPSIVSNRIHGT